MILMRDASFDMPTELVHLVLVTNYYKTFKLLCLVSGRINHNLSHVQYSESARLVYGNEENEKKNLKIE